MLPTRITAGHDAPTSPRVLVAVTVPDPRTGKLVLSLPARLIPLLLALAWLSLTDRLLPVALGGGNAGRGNDSPQQSSLRASDPAGSDPGRAGRHSKRHHDNHAAQMALYMVRC